MPSEVFEPPFFVCTAGPDLAGPGSARCRKPDGQILREIVHGIAYYPHTRIEISCADCTGGVYGIKKHY